MRITRAWVRQSSWPSSRWSRRGRPGDLQPCGRRVLGLREPRLHPRDSEGAAYANRREPSVLDLRGRAGLFQRLGSIERFELHALIENTHHGRNGGGVEAEELGPEDLRGDADIGD